MVSLRLDVIENASPVVCSGRSEMPFFCSACSFCVVSAPPLGDTDRCPAGRLAASAAEALRFKSISISIGSTLQRAFKSDGSCPSLLQGSHRPRPKSGRRLMPLLRFQIGLTQSAKSCALVPVPNQSGCRRRFGALGPGFRLGSHGGFRIQSALQILDLRQAHDRASGQGM